MLIKELEGSHMVNAIARTPVTGGLLPSFKRRYQCQK